MKNYQRLAIALTVFTFAILVSMGEGPVSIGSNTDPAGGPYRRVATEPSVSYWGISSDYIVPDIILPSDNTIARSTPTFYIGTGSIAGGCSDGNVPPHSQTAEIDAGVEWTWDNSNPSYNGWTIFIRASAVSATEPTSPSACWHDTHEWECNASESTVVKGVTQYSPWRDTSVKRFTMRLKVDAYGKAWFFINAYTDVNGTKLCCHQPVFPNMNGGKCSGYCLLCDGQPVFNWTTTSNSNNLNVFVKRCMGISQARHSGSTSIPLDYPYQKYEEDGANMKGCRAENTKVATSIPDITYSPSSYIGTNPWIDISAASLNQTIDGTGYFPPHDTSTSYPSTTSGYLADQYTDMTICQLNLPPTTSNSRMTPLRHANPTTNVSAPYVIDFRNLPSGCGRDDGSITTRYNDEAVDINTGKHIIITNDVSGGINCNN